MWLAAVTLLLIQVAGACGQGRSPSTPSVGQQPSLEAQQGTLRQEPLHVFSDEDLRVMSMPLEERIRYLERKLKDIVFWRYGIVIEESALDAKNVSLDDAYNKVCSGTEKEKLSLDQTTGMWEWTLSFLDRVCGDYNFDHVVDISDVTQIALHYGAKEGDDEWMEAPYHIDRNSNGDGVINIADVTPLAISFGKRLAGYNAYWRESPQDS